MPKAKITPETVVSSTRTQNRTPVRVHSTGTPMWYKVIMFGLMVLGLLWLVVNYLAGPQIPFMAELNQWNYAIGFGLFVLGLLMTMGWR